jgi:hypothetical protein
MPDAAAGLSELAQGDAGEAVMAGLEQHLCEQRASGCLTRGQQLARGMGLLHP